MSYKNTANVVTSSNEAANFLLRSATEAYADRLLNTWLLQNDGSSFFGKFGRPVYNPGSSIWESNGIKTQLPFNYFSGRDQKSMSLLSIGEWLKRLAMHKADPITALPHLTDLDLETIFYGKREVKWLEEPAKALLCIFIRLSLGSMTWDHIPLRNRDKTRKHKSYLKK